MRPYEPAMTIKDGYWPKNVQYQFTGHIGQAVREQLPNLANCLHDWIRRWVYDNEEDAYETMHKRLDYLLGRKYSPQFANCIREHVSFIINF